MKKAIRIITLCLLLTFLVAAVATPVYAITEEEVQERVDEQGREGVTGNIFIWFLCAIGFLKVSQKLDTHLSALGIHMGTQRNSMLGEAMIAARGIGAAFKGFGGGRFGGAGTAGAGAGTSGGGGGFLHQSLGTSIGHSIRSSAAKSATGQKPGGVGAAVFNRSLNKGGSFASSVVSRIAQGDVRSDGILRGEQANHALSQYLGFDTKVEMPGAKTPGGSPAVGGKPSATGSPNAGNPVPAFRDVEIGGGRISGREISESHPDGEKFGMYHADQYMEPKGAFETVQAVDGSKWYKQYAQDSVQKTPYTDAEGKVAYQEEIVRRVPDPPKRKDRL